MLFYVLIGAFSSFEYNLLKKLFSRSMQQEMLMRTLCFVLAFVTCASPAVLAFPELLNK